MRAASIGEPSPSGLEPLERPASLGEQVYARLRGMLRAREFEPGERLVDSAIARRLNVSRTPVREALMRLAADGLVETQAGGFLVPRLSLSDVQEIFEIRRLLEPSAVCQVARSLDDAGRADISRAMDAAEKGFAADDLSTFADANIAFRAAWVDRIPNGRMRETLLRFDDQVSMVRRMTLVDPTSRMVALTGLRRLAQALTTNDGEAASVAMTDFVDAALRSFSGLFQESGQTRAEERGVSETISTRSTEGQNP